MAVKVEQQGRVIPVVINQDAGYFLANPDVTALTEAMSDAIAQAGYQAAFHVGRAAEVDNAMDSAFGDPGLPVVFVMGGDGTVRSAIARAAESGRTLGIIPGGTMNVYARELNIPVDPVDATIALLNGQDQLFDVGIVNDWHFFGSAVMGVVPEVARVRERYRGKDPLVRAWSIIDASWLALRDRPALKLEFSADSRRFHTRTKAVVISNNELDPAIGMPLIRSGWKTGKLYLYIFRQYGLFRMLFLGLLFLLGRWKAEGSLMEIQCREIAVRKRKSRDTDLIDIMLDGEPLRMELPLHFRLLPMGLKLRCVGGFPGEVGRRGEQGLNRSDH